VALAAVRRQNGVEFHFSAIKFSAHWRGPAVDPRNPVQRRRGHGVVRRVVEFGVLLGIVSTMASEFLVEGWLLPIVVSSGSMATTLLGPHRIAHCPGCGMSFACDADNERSASVTAMCPNCGQRDIPFKRQVIRGDRLIVDRATFGLRRPRRWEIALFRCPESASDYCVKRIVGLPGEAIEIRGGDVYVDGMIARKSLAQQREMVVLVHDSAWIGGHHDLPDRWSPQTMGGWQRTGDGWRSVSPTPDPQWLNFTNWRRVTNSASAVEQSPILDEDGYNQAVSRQLNRVTDLMLVCKLSAVGDGKLLVKANDGRETFQVSVAPTTGAITLARSDREVISVQVAAGVLREPTELTISLIDQQIVVAIGDREEIVYQYEPLDRAIQGNATPFSIGAIDLEVQVSRLQVYRDVHYTPATRASDSKSCLLGADEYYVLGDNSPISRDSRPWMGGEIVRGSLMVGRPLAFFRRRENVD
jgi:signal peptidase I